MKKTTKKIITLLMTALVCSMLCGMMAMAATATLKPTVLRTGFRKAGTKVATYDLTLPAGQDELVLPVKIAEKGRVFIDAKAMGKLSIDASLYYDQACIKRALWSTWLSPEGPSCIDKYGSWREKGTYYLKISKDNLWNEAETEYNKNYEAKIQVKMCEYSGANATLESGKWRMVSSETDYVNGKSKYLGGFYKIKVPKKGYIKVETSKDSEKGGSFAFFNSKKKEYPKVEGWFSDDKGYSGHVCYVAVQKGTYYLQLKTSSDNKKIRYTFKADPSKTNYTRKKAASLKRGKLVENVFYTNAKKNTLERWYKITLTKKQRVEWQGYADLRDAKGYYVSTVYDNGKSYSRDKLKKGTYYFCVKEYEWNFIDKKRTMGEYKSFKWLK